jgi:hypothetical protein
LGQVERDGSGVNSENAETITVKQAQTKRGTYRCQRESWQQLQHLENGAEMFRRCGTLPLKASYWREPICNLSAGSSVANLLERGSSCTWQADYPEASYGFQW